MTATLSQDQRMYLPDAETIFSILWDRVCVSAGHAQPERAVPVPQQAHMQEAIEASAPAFDGSLLRSLALLSERVEALQTGIALTEGWLRDQTEHEAQLHQEMVARVDSLNRRVEQIASRLEIVSAHAAATETRLMQHIDELRQRLQRQEEQGDRGHPSRVPAPRRTAGSVIRSLLTHTLWLG